MSNFNLPQITHLKNGPDYDVTLNSSWVLLFSEASERTAQADFRCPLCILGKMTA
jgi:hypothetical protein